jgi:hypothetical protein
MKKNSTENNKISLNLNGERSDFNDFSICWEIFGTRPNKLSIYNSYKSEHFLEVVSELVQERTLSTEIVATNDGTLNISEEVFVKIRDTIYFSYFIVDKNSQNSIIIDLVFYYKDVEEDWNVVKEIVESLNDCILNVADEESHNLYNIVVSNGNVEMEPVNFSDDFTDIEFFYSENTFKKISKLRKKISKNDSGIYVLDGERGLGKTTLIKYLAEEVDKVFLHIPSNLVDLTINNPDFINILRKYQSPVIVLDDCETIMADMFGKTNQTVTNILQIVDGLTSSIRKVNIVCVFNEPIDEEDTILTANNFRERVEFDLLSPDESSELSKLIGFEKVYKNKNRLVDIINKKKNLEYKKIGF